MIKKENNEWKVAFIGDCMTGLETRHGGAIRQQCGGDTFNTAAYFSRLGKPFGMTAEYLSVSGDNGVTSGIRDFWSEENAASSFADIIPGDKQGLYYIRLNPEGESLFAYWSSEGAEPGTFEGGNPALGTLDSFDAVYLSGISLALLQDTGKDRLLDRLQTVRHKGVQIYFDCNFRPILWVGEKNPAENAKRWFQPLIAMSDVIFTARDEVEALGFEPDADGYSVTAALRSLGAGEVVLKGGADGCIVAHHDGTDSVPACDVKAIADTMAAGDSFAAAYLVCRRLGYTPSQSATMGHRLAATVVSRNGAIIPQEAMPQIFSEPPLP